MKHCGRCLPGSKCSDPACAFFVGGEFSPLAHKLNDRMRGYAVEVRGEVIAELLRLNSDAVHAIPEIQDTQVWLSRLFTGMKESTIECHLRSYFGSEGLKRIAMTAEMHRGDDSADAINGVGFVESTYSPSKEGRLAEVNSLLKSGVLRFDSDTCRRLMGELDSLLPTEPGFIQLIPRDAKPEFLVVPGPNGETVMVPASDADRIIAGVPLAVTSSCRHERLNDTGFVSYCYDCDAKLKRDSQMNLVVVPEYSDRHLMVPEYRTPEPKEPAFISPPPGEKPGYITVITEIRRGMGIPAAALGVATDGTGVTSGYALHRALRREEMRHEAESGHDDVDFDGPGEG